MTSVSIHDLDELLLAVRDPESKRLLMDAINAYRGGACRSALISTWVAVAYDIIAKIRELSSQGDAAALAFIQDLDSAIQQNTVEKLQRIERELLDTARTKFELLTRHEADHLDHLKQDRNACAHPAFVAPEQIFAPTPESVRAYLAHAVLYLLRHPPVQGKVALERLRRDILGNAFPTEKAKIETVMRENYLFKAREMSVVAIAKNLFLAPIRSNKADYIGKELELAYAFASVGKSHAALFEQHIPTFVQKVCAETGEPEIFAFFRYVAAEPRIWSWLDQSSRIRLTTLLEKTQLKTLSKWRAFDAMHVADIQAVLQPRFQALEDVEKYDVIAQNPHPAFTQEAIRLYCDSGSFRGAERNGIQLLLPHATFIDSGMLGTLMQGIVENSYDQIIHAAGTPQILVLLFDQTKGLLPGSRPTWQILKNKIVEEDQEKAFANLFSKFEKHGI